MGNTMLNTQGITRVKCVAAVLVVLIHAVALPVNSWGMESSPLYMGCYSIGMIGVPLFLTCSGALLLQEKYGTWQKSGEIKRRMIRILVPLLVYGWVYAMMEIFFERRTLTLQMPLEALGRVFTGKSWGHLWYLYMLLGLYLLVPCIRHLHWNTNADQKKLIFAVMVSFGVVMPVVARLLAIEYLGSNLISLGLPSPLCHILSFWTGAIITQKDLKKARKYIDIAGIVSLIIMVVIPILCDGIEAKKLVLGYDSVFVWLSTVWVFTRIYNRSYRDRKMISAFEKLSFGIYLIHPVCMNLLYKALHLTPMMGSAVLTIPLFVILMLVPSYIAAWIASKLPIVKKWLI